MINARKRELQYCTSYMFCIFVNFSLYRLFPVGAEFPTVANNRPAVANQQAAQVSAPESPPQLPSQTSPQVVAEPVPDVMVMTQRLKRKRELV